MMVDESTSDGRPPGLGGYWEKILRVDLTEKKTRILSLDPNDARRFIGGSGLACRLLYRILDAATDPLSPENTILFMTGPLTATAAPSSGRFAVCSRSPATHLWGESSCGGIFGAKLKLSGFDGILLTGRADQPVYLTVLSGQPSVEDASHLWGKTTDETRKHLLSDVGRTVGVASIGPAGENLVKYACIVADWGRTAGRTGMGAVMGSKNLKAVAVDGAATPPLADEERFRESAQAASEKVREHVMFKVFSETGTAGYVDFAQVLGALSAKYFSNGVFEGADNISGATMCETILTGTSACHGCFIGCGRVVEIKEGKYRLPATKGPEYETVAAFGANLLCDDLRGICLANKLCNSLGLDTISCGVSIGFAYHLFEKGVIDPRDTGGLGLKWGEIDPAIALIQMIAHREGIGDVLAEGVRAMGEKFGAGEDAAHVNGLELSFQEPRALHGMAVCYATSPRGACHNQADMFMVEIGWGDEELGIESKDRLQDESKGMTAARLQDYRAVTNSLIICSMAYPTSPLLAEMLTHATGWESSVEDLQAQGERIVNLKRAFNLRMGYRTANERLPRILASSLEGGSQGTAPDLEKQLRQYYAYRQWDRESGKPEKEKLLDLGLADVAHDLWG